MNRQIILTSLYPCLVRSCVPGRQGGSSAEYGFYSASVMSFYFGLLLRISVPALCLVLSLGCADVKVVTRDANDALLEVMTLTEFDEGRAEERLYAVEKHILDTCQILFISTDFKLLGEGIPLLTKLGALFSSGICRQTVDDALRELDAIRKIKKLDRLKLAITQ